MTRATYLHVIRCLVMLGYDHISLDAISWAYTGMHCGMTTAGLERDNEAYELRMWGGA